MRARPHVSWDLGPCSSACGVEQLSRAFGLGSDGPWGRPAVPDDRRSGPRAHGVDEPSLVTQARVRWPAGWTSSHGRLALGSVGPQIRPALHDDSCSGPMVRGVDQLFRAIGLGPDGLQARPAVPEDSRPPPIACRLDHMSLGTWGRVPVPAVSNSSPGQLWDRTDGPRHRPAFPGDSGSCPMTPTLDQHSRGTPACVRGPAVSNSYPM